MGAEPSSLRPEPSEREKNILLLRGVPRGKIFPDARELVQRALQGAKHAPGVRRSPSSSDLGAFDVLVPRGAFETALVGSMGDLLLPSYVLWRLAHHHALYCTECIRKDGQCTAMNLECLLNLLSRIMENDIRVAASLLFHLICPSGVSEISLQHMVSFLLVCVQRTDAEESHWPFSTSDILQAVKEATATSLSLIEAAQTKSMSYEDWMRVIIDGEERRTQERGINLWEELACSFHVGSNDVHSKEDADEDKEHARSCTKSSGSALNLFSFIHGRAVADLSVYLSAAIGRTVNFLPVDPSRSGVPENILKRLCTASNESGLHVGFVCCPTVARLLAMNEECPVEIVACPVLESTAERLNAISVARSQCGASQSCRTSVSDCERGPTAGARTFTQSNAVYFSDVIVRADSPLHSVEDLQGSIAAYNDDQSYSGYYCGVHYLDSIGRDVSFFRQAFPSGGHRWSVAMVASGLVDVAAIDCSVLHQLRRTAPHVASKLRVLCRLGPNPIQPLIMCNDLPEELKCSIRKAVLEMHEVAEGRDVLRGLGFAAFVEVDRKHLETVGLRLGGEQWLEGGT